MFRTTRRSSSFLSASLSSTTLRTRMEVISCKSFDWFPSLLFIPIVYFRKSTAQALVAKLRKEYVKIGIDFALDSFTQIHNSDWFHNAAPGTPAMERMMHVLRPIGPNFLHIFTVNFTSAKWHAYSSAVPWHYPSAPLFDGVLLHHSVVRQKKPEAISAVALWFGASHIYQNGCDDIFGDSVDDTPPQSGPVKGCPTAHKSCPGNHPSDRKWIVASSLWSPVTHALPFPVISNYMNGAGDSCMNSFTPGQIRRMQWMLSVYRGFNITIGTGVDPL